MAKILTISENTHTCIYIAARQKRGPELMIVCECMVVIKDLHPHLPTLQSFVRIMHEDWSIRVTVMGRPDSLVLNRIAQTPSSKCASCTTIYSF